MRRNIKWSFFSKPTIENAPSGRYSPKFLLPLDESTVSSVCKYERRCDAVDSNRLLSIYTLHWSLSRHAPCCHCTLPIPLTKFRPE